MGRGRAGKGWPVCLSEGTKVPGLITEQRQVGEGGFTHSDWSVRAVEPLVSALILPLQFM